MTRIDSINGSSIKAGEPVKIWISENESQIYEIKYIYDKTIPAKLAPSMYHSIDFSSLKADDSAKTSGADEDITDNIIGKVTIYSKSGRGYKVADLSSAPVTLYGKTYSGKRIGLYSQNSSGQSFSDTLDENGNATDSTHSAVEFVPQHDNASVEVVWTRGSDNTDAVLNAYSDGTVTELGQITAGGLDEPAKSKLNGLKAGKPVYIYATKGFPRIYEINYIYPGETTYDIDNLQQVSETTTWSNFSDASYTAVSLVDSYDTLRVYADESNNVNYNENHAGEIDFRGIGNFSNGNPTSRVLEINPKTTGIVEVGFSGGGSGSPRKLVIEQNGVIKGSAIRNTGSSENTVAKAYVDADIPVYIYSSDYIENGKLSNSGRTDEWAQINAGTILTLPNVHKGTTLTFALYGDTGLIIDGTTYKNGESYTTVKNGSIVMTATGTQTYIATITVTGESFIIETTEPTPTPNPLDNSHVGYWKMDDGIYGFDKKYTSNYGKTIYGSTISTGFVTSVPVESANGETYINWTITIPTGDGETRTFIKDPGFTDLNSDTSGNEDQLAFLNELLSNSEWAVDMNDVTDEGTDSIGDELDLINNTDSELNDNNYMVDMSEENDNDVQWIIDEISILSELESVEQLTSASNSLTANVGDAAISDGNVQINKGTIYPVNSFGSNNGSSVQIKLRYKLPSMTTITNTNITVGLVIDNLYAPGAYVTVNGGVTTGNSSGTYNEFTHGTDDTVTAESYEEGYRDNAANPYNKAKEAISE